MTGALLTLAIVLGRGDSEAAKMTRPFTVERAGEVVSTITARCARCDWSKAGRETVILELSVDGHYSQHLALIRGEDAAPYRVLLGELGAGQHTLSIRRDERRSAIDAGPFTIDDVRFETFGPGAPEHEWIAQAPMLRARPGSVETFSDFPLLMYAERDASGEGGRRYRYQYTVIFTNEDGGTPTDRLMATWGRTTDIEFVYGVTPAANGESHALIQIQGHKWVDFSGPRVGAHPVLWVATDNNMVADHGPDDVVTFAPAPVMFALGERSREAVMDAEPWIYAVSSAEMVREHRIDPDADAGSGKIPEPRRYATLEACGEVVDAAIAFDIGVRAPDGGITWHATDRGNAAFRIVRGGCFRGSAPVSVRASPRAIVGVRVRAYPRPRTGDSVSAGAGRVVLRRVNRVFMLDSSFEPADAPIRWNGELAVPLTGAATDVVRAPRE